MSERIAAHLLPGFSLARDHRHAAHEGRKIDSAVDSVISVASVDSTGHLNRHYSRLLQDAQTCMHLVETMRVRGRSCKHTETDTGHGSPRYRGSSRAWETDFHLDTDSAARICRPPLWLAANIEAIYRAVSVVWSEEYEATRHGPEMTKLRTAWSCSTACLRTETLTIFES